MSKTSFEFAPKGIKTKKTELETTTIGLEKKDLTKDVYAVISTDKKGVKIKTILDLFAKKEFEVYSKKSFQFRLNTFNFPGWKANIDSKEIKINDDNDYKLITVLVPKGNHKLSFVFENTLIRKLGNLTSIIFLIGLLFCIIHK